MLCCNSSIGLLYLEQIFENRNASLSSVQIRLSQVFIFAKLSTHLFFHLFHFLLLYISNPVLHFFCFMELTQHFTFHQTFCSRKCRPFWSIKALNTPSCLLSIIFHSVSPSSPASAGRRRWPKPRQWRRGGGKAHVLVWEAVSQHSHHGHHDRAAKEAAARCRVAQGAEEAQVQPVGQQRHQPP